MKFLKAPGLLEVLERDDARQFKACALSAEERFALVRSVGVECVQDAELRALLAEKRHPIVYDGFEPSGRMHIAQGLFKAQIVNRLTAAGCVFVFWVADWFALLNNKMGGDLEKIRTVGRYFEHVWHAVGMDLTNVVFLWASEEIERDSAQYWLRVMDIAKRNTISRVKRCGQIMGRAEHDEQPAAQIFYPCMQAADIFYIGADICQLGLDQRKVNMLAREYVAEWNAQHRDAPLRKPVVLSHEMLPGLLEGQEKMSKSDADSAIFMEDAPEDIRRKIKKAFCPPQVVAGNPLLAYVRVIVLPAAQQLTVARKPEHGGEIRFASYAELERAYAAGELHPGDLKPAVAAALVALLAPVREYFATHAEAQRVLAAVKTSKISK